MKLSIKITLLIYLIRLEADMLGWGGSGQVSFASIFDVTDGFIFIPLWVFIN